MAEPTAGEESYRFSNWEVRPGQRALRVEGQPVRIGSRAFDLLLAFVRQPGRVLGKAELLDAAWPGLVVEENNLSVQISGLRKMLGADVIANVSGVGYMLTAAPAAPARPPAAAPADTSTPGSELVGRDAELELLATRLGAVRVLSIVGPGGVGKTALARALLARTAGGWLDGAHWVDLTTLQPGAALLPVVAGALGILADEASLRSGDVQRSLEGVQAVVVLDNCEHMLDAVVDGLTPLLRMAPRLCWVVTSQEPLHLSGEEVHRLAPLPVPPRRAESQDPWGSSALALFVRRAQLSGSDLAKDERSMAMAVDVCRALDGLPLALEIAAARVATLGLQGVHDQLARSLSLRNSRRDAPVRHHSLQSAYTWSHDLLTPIEQRLFRRLQPFHGGFTTAMALAMAAPLAGEPAGVDADELADTLGMLVDKSLVQRVAPAAPGATPRYRLLESAREFARLRLDAEQEFDAVQRRHAEVTAESFSQAWDELLNLRDAEWLARYLVERDNLSAALCWACEHQEPALLATLLIAGVLIDNFRDAEASAVACAVPLDVLERAPPRWRARAAVEYGWAQYLHGNREQGTALIERGLDDSQTCGDLACTFLALTRLVRLHGGQPAMADRAQALWLRLEKLEKSEVPLRLKLYCQSTAGRYFGRPTRLEQLQQLCVIARQAGHELQAAICQTNLTDELLLQGRFEEVVVAAKEMLEGHRHQARLRAYVSFNLAHALVRLGRFEEAEEACRRVLRALPGQAHMVLDLFALAAVAQSRWRDAALMRGCSRRIQATRNWRADPAEAALNADTLRALEGTFDRRELDGLFDLGASMAVGDVLALAGFD